MVKAGTVLQDRYQIIKTLGCGGMGRVYLAQHLALGDLPVAVKELEVHLDPETLELASAEFQKEATMLAHLEHPGLLRASDFFEEESHCYIVMDYVAGPTLHELIEQSQGFLPLDQVLEWALQLTEVLVYLHGRKPAILHRDIKPGNILLDPSGRVRLIDFGIARFSGPGMATATLWSGAGTPGFAPVEQFSGGTDERSDIYSLGATLYNLATRKVPANSVAIMAGDEILVPPRQHNPELPWAFQDLLLKMLATRRDDRFGSVLEVQTALSRLRSPQVSAVAREFRICALCRHLQMSGESPAEYLFSCQVLGWKSQESRIAEAVARHLKLDSRRPRDCPHWEPAI